MPSSQHPVATKHSRSQRAQLHFSTTTSCTWVWRVCIPTHSNPRNARTVQCAAERPSRSQSIEIGRSNASSNSLSKSRTCAHAFTWSLPPFAQRPSSQIKKPSLSTPTKNIYLQAPPQLEAATRPNLENNVSDFVPGGGEVTVTATSFPFNLSLKIVYT